MKVLGVDPGLYGALATWDGEILLVVDVPIVKAKGRGNEINIPALVDIMHILSNPQTFEVAYIERNSVRPKEGLSSAQKNGLTVGILTGLAAAYCQHIVRPTPTQWKRIMGLTKDKDYSRTKAIETFPAYHKLFARKKDHGRAEAALLAHYGYMKSRSGVRKRLR